MSQTDVDVLRPNGAYDHYPNAVYAVDPGGVLEVWTAEHGVLLASYSPQGWHRAAATREAVMPPAPPRESYLP